MRVMLEERLIELRNKLPDSLVKSFIDSLIAECEELPDQQWQTIEEFKANKYECFCWIKLDYDNPLMGYFADGYFFDNSDDVCIFDKYITHAMPIKTPEAPK